jgi:hypothetical protein
MFLGLKHMTYSTMCPVATRGHLTGLISAATNGQLGWASAANCQNCSPYKLWRPKRALCSSQQPTTACSSVLLFYRFRAAPILLSLSQPPLLEASALLLLRPWPRKPRLRPSPRYAEQRLPPVPDLDYATRCGGADLEGGTRSAFL